MENKQLAFDLKGRSFLVLEFIGNPWTDFGIEVPNWPYDFAILPWRCQFDTAKWDNHIIFAEIIGTDFALLNMKYKQGSRQF